jgi:hypothetical protein
VEMVRYSEVKIGVASWRIRGDAIPGELLRRLGVAMGQSVRRTPWWSYFLLRRYYGLNMEYGRALWLPGPIGEMIRLDNKG